VVKQPAVVDSACLIGLERIARLDLLPALLEPVFVPTAVAAAFGSCPPWMRVASPSDQGMVATLKLIVDPGESEAIALAYEKGLRLVLDDRRAREVAQRLGLKITGTVGLLLLAKQAGANRGDQAAAGCFGRKPLSHLGGAPFRRLEVGR
jgi:predicted nucleic acid-binding protein